MVKLIRSIASRLDFHKNDLIQSRRDQVDLVVSCAVVSCFDLISSKHEIERCAPFSQCADRMAF